MSLDPKTLANAVRMLSVDAVQQANSGHPGAPMGMADIAEVLWRHHLKHNPTDPTWINRDRFVLSNGHGSMLLYSLLHLTGYDLPLAELKQFRQLHSKTPGHPEYGYAPGIETTTGPLGQGIANAVGMALAEKTLAAQFNKPGHDIVDHYTYAFMGDGCLMEGISHEVCSLAGTLELGKLIAFWDDNGISIDGHVDGWFTDDTPARFRAYGWQVIDAVDGHDPQAIDRAIKEAKKDQQRPTLICCKTIIGYGSPNKSGSHDCHGAPLGNDEITKVREFLHWPHAPFEIPQDIYQAWDAKAQGEQVQKKWKQQFAAYQEVFPQEAAELLRRSAGTLTADWTDKANAYIADLQANPANIASRQASQKALNEYAKILPELLGGSADLAPSNLTRHTSALDVSAATPQGNYMHYGVREFGMSAIMNGVTLHGGFIPYGGTFLMFMEYARNAVRMAALMKQRSIFVYTHDSIGLGEDGPTHQPVEQLASLRLTPNMETWRPCDQVESAVSWRAAIERQNGPSALIFSRQNLTQQPRTTQQVQDIERGGYTLLDCDGTPELIIMATGSEVGLAVNAAKTLQAEGKKVRVVSLPCTERFDKQSAEYKELVLPKAVRARLAIEASIADYWQRYTGLDGEVIGMTGFGESAPAEQLFKLFGFSDENVLEKARKLLV
ncbi:transketolase [Tolumonas auensis DSM 9187]|uniref:Transketolase n=1 Tax=Tolumonas auensis (strain DSM 9187 / NBRC 110442 / TA 4) TaxID=595494 RepID=C4LDR6_TOLAT|nr:transketolase [Tolumonas auensis]ACQ94677.1 transketolase [Tolumonas auensis DSM 9187]